MEKKHSSKVKDFHLKQDIIQEIIDEMGDGGITLDDLVREGAEYKISEKEARYLVDNLVKNGKLAEAEKDRFTLV